jgi:alkyl sulfatase BDS1-like metallo-beta-lactamase superfamily hydrolase
MKHRRLVSVIICGAFAGGVSAQEQSKPATEATKKANAAVLQELPFSNKQDFENAQRGFMAPLSCALMRSGEMSSWLSKRIQMLTRFAP